MCAVVCCMLCRKIMQLSIINLHLKIPGACVLNARRKNDMQA
jgi:hypothetical protein